jgi:hypothetical protein
MVIIFSLTLNVIDYESCDIVEMADVEPIPFNRYRAEVSGNNSIATYINDVIRVF